MNILNTKFAGLKIIKQKNNLDASGFLRETHNQKILKKKKFVFEYCTSTKAKILRGFHFQTNYKQAKYVNVIKGRILDCVIDLRKSSKTFGKSFKIILSDKNCLGLYIPEGFAHAYYSFERLNIVYYKLSNYYMPKYESGIIWNDNKIKIDWPNKNPILSKKDRKLKTFDNFCLKSKYL